MTKQISIADASTGEIIVREMNDEELAQYKKDQVKRAEIEQAKVQAEAQGALKKSEAEAKLVALGLTADDLKALGLG